MASLSSIGQDQFMRLFLAQLQNQNPLEPISDRDMISQLTQLSTIQGISQLNANFADLLQLQQLTQGSALIGRTITYQPPNATAPARGVVSSLVVENGSIILRVGTANVPLNQVRGVEPTP